MGLGSLPRVAALLSCAAALPQVQRYTRQHVPALEPSPAPEAEAPGSPPGRNASAAGGAQQQQPATASQPPGPDDTSWSATGYKCPANLQCAPLAGTGRSSTDATENDFVFYNRVPKTGSTTFLAFLDAAAKTNGYRVIHSNDFEADHFNPTAEDARRQITAEMMEEVGTKPKGERVVFERHMHYLNFSEFHLPKPIYLNLLREPTAMRTSAFYFFRDCVCSGDGDVTEMKDGAEAPSVTRTYKTKADLNGNAWCQKSWWRKSPQFCKTTINECFDDIRKCERDGHHTANGQPLTKFLCGTSPECQEKDSEAKLQLAKDNLVNEYSWVGLIEALPNSLELLSKMMPSFFGNMDLAQFGQMDINPMGKDEHQKKYEQPTEDTITKMRSAAAQQREYDMYAFAFDVFRCRLKACGIHESFSVSVENMVAMTRSAAA